jgi:hypothetical protein
MRSPPTLSPLFPQTVIFLYLLDSDTSWVILLSHGAGLVIEAWKLRKAVAAITIARAPGAWRPRLVLTPTAEYETSGTQAHDEEAMRYLECVMYPLVIG